MGGGEAVDRAGLMTSKPDLPSDQSSALLTMRRIRASRNQPTKVNRMWSILRPSLKRRYEGIPEAPKSSWTSPSRSIWTFTKRARPVNSSASDSMTGNCRTQVPHQSA